MIVRGASAAAARRPAAAPVTSTASRRPLRAAAAMAPFRGMAVQKKGDDFKVMEYEPKPLGPRDIEIAVTHNGFCHSDLHMRTDDWGISAFPLIAGHEVVGDVVAVGSEVTAFEVGSVVGYGWLKGSCRACSFCLRGEENLCLKGQPTIVGAGNYGGFQPRVRLPADFAYRIPEGLSRADAAPLLCAGITVYAPLRKHIKHPGQAVAVLGVGGLGHLAVQFAAAMGARVTALVLTDAEAAEARALGASDALSSSAAFEGRRGAFDVLINCASARVDFKACLGTLRPDGVMVQVGIPGGNAEITLPLQDLVFAQKSVAGSIVGGRADMQEMLDFAVAKGIKPKIELFKLSQINEAAARVASGQARYRVVMETDAI